MAVSQVSNNRNPLQPSGFEFVADRRRLSNITFFAQSISHPSSVTNAAEVPYRDYVSVPNIGDKIQYGPLSVQVLLDEDMQSYQEIIDWMEYNIYNEDPGVADENSHFADLTLNILSSKNTLIQRIQYQDAFPTDIGEINMMSSVSGTQVITFPVTFRLTKFKIVTA